MLFEIGILGILGVILGGILGVVSKFLAVEIDPIEQEILNLLPGSQCGQCGYVGCSQAAAALANGSAPPTICTPGGKSVAEKLAKRLGVSLNPSALEDTTPRIAVIQEDICIGCTRCLMHCSTDAIIGAAKQLHTVLSEACMGCGKCVDECQTEAIRLIEIPKTVATWHWTKPQVKS